jgi:urease accessory protein
MDVLMRQLAARLQGIRRPAQEAVLASIIVMSASRTACAHLVTSGVGPFYDGMAHFFLSPDDLLVVVALALAGGSAGKHVAKWVAVVLPLAWLFGMLLVMVLPATSEVSPAIGAVTMLTSGLLLCVFPTGVGWIVIPTVAVTGVVHGWLNGNAVALTGTSLLAGLGIVTASAVVGLLLSAISISWTGGWQRIMLRVAGSWIAAIGLLALAWQFRTVAT